MKNLLKRQKFLVISLVLIFLLSNCFTAFAASAPAEAPNYEVRYLAAVHQIDLPDTITKGEFGKLLNLLLGDERFLVNDQTEALQQISVLEAVSLGIKAANMEELARTYPNEKINRAFKKIDFDFNEQASSLAKAAAQDLALALDVELVPAGLIKGFKVSNLLSPNQAAIILTRVLDIRGQYKNYLGTVVDKDIYGRVFRAIENVKKVNDEKLLKALDAAIEQGLTTGYNIRDLRNNSNFDANLTIRYGHDNPIHAIQLIGLLRSEGLNAKVNIETKTSSYKHMAEWGTDLNSNYELIPAADGNYYAHVKEYDTLFEFATVQQKNKFQDIIFKYAKKNEANQAGLIYQAWWQPLYTSNTKIDQYETMTDNIVRSGDFEAHVYTLNQDSQALVEALKKLDPRLEIRTEVIWVDVPFYNYLKGEAM